MGLDPSPSRELSGPPNSLPPESWSSRALSVRVEEQDATLLLRLTGEFDWACVGRVEAALDRISAATRHVVFDLRGLTFLDSGGLKTILRVNDRAGSGSFDLVVVRPRGLANRVFTLTRAGQQLAMVDRPPSRTAGTGA
jgi:anti-sigma B factor antagonist